MGILKLCRFQGNTGILFVLSVILLCSLVVGWCHHIMHSFVLPTVPIALLAGPLQMGQ